MTDFAATLPQPPRQPSHVSQEGYGRALCSSFIAHLLFILLILAKSLVFPSQSKPYIPTLRVDLVGLPDVLKKDLQNLPPTATSQDIAAALKSATADAKSIKPVKIPDAPKIKEPAETADPDELVLHPKKTVPQEKPVNRDKKLRSALDRIKALSKISGDESAQDHPEAPAKVIKGNQVSKGTSLSGDAKEAAESSYYDLLRSKLQENWSLPVWIQRQNYSAQILLFIDAFGRVRSFHFVKPSGNAQFDSAVKKTLDESQPFPRPPEGIAASLLSNGVTIGFPL